MHIGYGCGNGGWPDGSVGGRNRSDAGGGGSRGTGITSPEVASDRRVTFRLRAPEAKAVTVSGDFGSDTTMQKSEDGLWSVTVGPLDAELYVY